MTKIQKMALEIVKREKAWREQAIDEYEHNAREDYRNGYRPHYCIHGTNQWSDYDVLCWACEEYGWNQFPDYLETLRHALAEAKHRMETANQRAELALPIAADTRLYPELRENLIEWVNAPLDLNTPNNSW